MVASVPHFHLGYLEPLVYHGIYWISVMKRPMLTSSTTVHRSARKSFKSQDTAQPLENWTF